MSLTPLRNAALATVAALGATAAFSVNKMYLPSKTQQLAESIRGDLDVYNSNVGEDQYSNVTLFDRRRIMADVKDQKPWNRSSAEKKRDRQAEDSV